jgi:catechol 2,3-dioxygenase-like lactoylglutathione lyase family enzyme
MQIHSVFIPVNDIDLAINFYTKNLFFDKKLDIAKNDKKTGLAYRKVSLVSTQSNSPVEIGFSTFINSFKPLLIYQKELHKLGVPYVYLSVANIDVDYNRLSNLGIVFSVKPKLVGMQKIAVFDDGCGNHIQLIERI